MRKQPVTQEKIRALAEGGYSFREKRSKAYYYMSARKSGAKDIALGRHSDELWAVIQETVKSVKEKGDSTGFTPIQEDAKEVVVPFILAWKDLEENMIKYRFWECSYRGSDSFCGYWLLGDLPMQSKQRSSEDLERSFRKVISVDGRLYCWAFKTTVGICASCPSFVAANERYSSQFPKIMGKARGYMQIYP